MEHVIVHPEAGEPVPLGAQGLLLVRGPNVFSGYMGNESGSPFVEFQGEQWYSTGDLVCEDDSNILTFKGRLKRFIKLAGEMISLPAIEEVLIRNLSTDNEGPQMAVEATQSEDHPEIVLFTTLDIDREQCNNMIRNAGLSGLHNIRKVVKVDVIPILGTGKTDYKQLRESLSLTQP